MKIYTKILIGMAVGAVIGLTLGPKSSFLKHDSYEIDKGAKVTLLTDKDNPDSEITIRATEALSLRAQQTIMKDVTDGNGKTQSLASLVRVKFSFSKKMALGDKDGSMSKALGNAKVGDKVEAWLVMQHRKLDSGELLVLPVPVSAIGSTVVAVLSPIGQLFMRLIKMVIVPLVSVSYTHLTLPTIYSV